MDYLWLLFIIPAWFLWNLAHEGAHVAAAKIEGYEITGFYPYPHRHEDRWFFARMSYRGEPTTKIHLAPYLVDLIAFAATYPILWIVPPAPEGVITVVVLSRPVVNTAVGVLGRYRMVQPEADLARVSWGWATVVLALWGAYLAALGLWAGSL